jgi:hypothetical protein
MLLVGSCFFSHEGKFPSPTRVFSALNLTLNSSTEYRQTRAAQILAAVGFNLLLLLPVTYTTAGA